MAEDKGEIELDLNEAAGYNTRGLFYRSMEELYEQVPGCIVCDL